MPIRHKQFRAASPSSRRVNNVELLSTSTPKEPSGVLNRELDREPLSNPIGAAHNSDWSYPTFEPRPSHVRSHSHPLASVSTPGSPSTLAAKGRGGLRTPEQNDGKAGRGQTLNVFAENDLINGRCATCNTLVRWPKQLDVFRCTVCLMINDLKPSRNRELQPSKHTSPVLLESTRTIAIDCIRRHIRSTSAFVSSTAKQISGEKPEGGGTANTALSAQSWVDEHNRRLFLSDEKTVSQQRIFQRLEEHIISCFSDTQLLNSSFAIPKSATIPDTPIESSSSDFTRGRDLKSVSSGILPEIDAKTLLVGDAAENGTWWAGRSPSAHITRSQPEKGAKAAMKGASDILKSSSMGIDWCALQHWYDFILNLNATIYSEIERTEVYNVQPGLTQRICQDLAQPCANVQNVLLKATEMALRRPGRPLVSPADCRFMLIILANPLLRVVHGPQLRGNKKDNLSLEAANNPKHLESQSNMSFPRTQVMSPLDYRQSSLSSSLKRVLGLIANAPPLCQHNMVIWLSALPRTSFGAIVELIERFVTYRLAKQDGRKRRNSHDPIASELIPSAFGHEPTTAAQLHATITAGGGIKDRAAVSNMSYGDDWQLRAAARVILLLFNSNQSVPIRQQERACLASRQFQAMRLDEVSPSEQKVPISSFYNSRVDSCDLVSDFEVWESRRGKFCFCQYPMFLSLRAKISIMEYEARRQMEIKAREAFFNSILGRKAISQYLVLKVRRDCLAEDSLRTISEIVGTGQEEIKKGLRVEFLGEEGLDSGGLRKEWFLLLVREVFDVSHGLFVYDEQSNYCYFNPHSFENSDQFFLVGVLLGLAIYNSTILDVALPPFAFRKLLASAPGHDGPVTYLSRPPKGCNLDDLAEYKPALAHGLRKLLDFEGDVEGTFLQDFVAPIERFGQIQHIPLCPNGEHRPVTAANRKEYVDLYTRYLLDKSVQRQFEPFKRGFFTVCGGNALSLFRASEIELLIRGSDEPLDVSTLKAVAIHENWPNKDDPATAVPLCWFWEAFTEAHPSHQRRLLSFITASDRIPAVGAASLVIRIHCLGNDVNRYPIARTCFNMIGLYNYHSKKDLEEKLWGAVMGSEGFGLK